MFGGIAAQLCLNTPVRDVMFAVTLRGAIDQESYSSARVVATPVMLM